MLGVSRPPRHSLSVAAAALLLANLALCLLVTPRAEAAAYYVGGGKGVKLAVRVVDRQIVWSKVVVRERCDRSDRSPYERTQASEGLMKPVPVGRGGTFRWVLEDRRHTKGGYRAVTVQDVVGRIGPRRLIVKFLRYNWFVASKPGTHIYGNCRGGAALQPSDPPEAVPIRARRRSEPRGLHFYYGEKKKGITTLFEVRGRRIVRAQTWATLYCTDPHGRRYLSRETKDWYTPIRLGASWMFETDEVREELPFETLRGEVRSGRITGRYGYSYAYPDGRHCRTGWFEPGHGRSWAVPFVAPRQ